MRRLQIDQQVRISLDEEPTPIECRVVEVQGSMSRLAYNEELSPRAVGQLAVGAAGYLVFEHAGAAVGLRVVVRASPPCLDAAVIDGVALPERRAGERVRLVARAGIVLTDAREPGRPPGWTETIDLSESGALLRRHPALEDQQRFALELMFGEDPRPVTAQASVARRTHEAVGVAFDSIPEQDAERLAEYLMGVRHRREPCNRPVSASRRSRA